MLKLEKIKITCARPASLVYFQQIANTMQTIYYTKQILNEWN